MHRRILILLLTLLTVLPAAAQQKVFLFSVGIADYPGWINDLSLTVNDAKRMKLLYQQNSNAEVKLLLNEEATVDNILSGVRSFFAKASKDDIIVFFFSGHGLEGGFVAYDDLLTYDALKKAMGTSRSKNKMIFADACLAGGLRGGTNTVSPEHKNSNVMLLLASRTNEISYERPDLNMKNGLFTTCLLDALRGKADTNRDRTITAKELFVYVSKNVALLSGDNQHPVAWGNFPDDMPVMKW